MVIPRSRSSGALSIESNERNLMFGLCFDNTLVIAAVRVVLSWSMCPIVPTFTCGFVRSNFSFAMSFPYSFSLFKLMIALCVAINLLVLVPQSRIHLLQSREIELAQLALV